MNSKKSLFLCLSGFTLTVLMFSGVGCNKNSSTGAGKLPEVAALGACGETYPAPSGCEWALSMDAIVWGTLVNLRPITLPAVIPDTSGNHVWVDSCDGAINIALELEISIERVISGEADDTIKVRIGNEQAHSFNPMPENSGGKVVWTRGGVTVGGGLAVGQKIGLPLHWMAADQEWSLMGEIMFELKADEASKEAIVFQSVNGDCRPRVPDGVAGLSLDELASLIATCSSEDAQAAQERKEQMVQMWGTRPECYLAPVCIPRQELQDGGTGSCDSDADCGAKEYCNFTVGKCRIQCTGKCGGPDACGGTCFNICPAGQTCQAPEYTICS